MSLTPTNSTEYVFNTPVRVLATGTVTSSTGQTTSMQLNGGLAVAKNIIVGGTSLMGGLAEFKQDSTFRQDVIVEGAVTSGLTIDGAVVPALYSNNFLISSYVSPSITSTATITLDSFSSSVYRTAKYTAQIITGSKIHSSEILLFHNNSEVFLTEYGVLTTNEELGTFDAELVSTTVNLKFTPSSSNLTVVKIVRVGITV